jgi:glycerophosphoryl diester phosphodiesterase
MSSFSHFMGSRVLNAARPLVLAHRMMITGVPENTILALQQAINIRVDWVEFDVKVLADGEMVSMHDELVDRTTDGHGNITQMTLKEVKQLNAGKGYSYGFVPVPTVEEIMQVLATSPYPIKAEMHLHNLWEPEPLILLLKKYGLQNRCFFNLNAMVMGEYMRDELKDDTSLLSLNISGESDELRDICNRFNMSYLCIPYRYLNEKFVQKIHHYRAHNPVFVHSYPVNTENEWQSLIDMGVDVIQTDFPEALQEFLNL